MNQVLIKELVVEASDPGCSEQRLHEIQEMLELEIWNPAYDTDSAVVGMIVIVNRLFVGGLHFRPDQRVRLCPVFVVICDRGKDVRSLIEESVRNEGIIDRYDVRAEVAKASALGARVPSDKMPVELTTAIHRNNEIQIELGGACRIDAGLRRHGRDAAFRFVFRTVWRLAIKQTPRQLLDFLPLFALLCGDRDGGITADIDWSLVP